MHYTVAQLVGTGTPTDPFRPPTAEEFTIIDLRPLSAQEAGKVDGYVLVATPERVKRLGLYLGDNATEISTVMAKNLSSRLGINLDADPTLGELIGELLTRHATPAHDDSRWNPLQGTKTVRREGNLWRFEAYLGNEVVWEREVLRADGGQQYTDNFNRSNASNLTSPWQPRDGGVLPIVSQKVVPSGSGGDLAVYLQPLNTNDHWCQIDMVSADVNFRGIDTQVRMQSSSTDLSGYGTGYIVGGGGYEIYRKASNGNQTTLFSQSGTQAQTSSIRTDINGSTLKGTVSGTVRGTVTDTTITAGKYAGIFTYQAQSNISLDNFVASDFQAVFSGDATIATSGVERSVTKKNPFTATVASSGAFSKIRAVYRAFTGTIASAGVIRRALVRVFSGAVQPTAPGPTKKPIIGTNLAGTVASTAKIKFTPIRRFAGTVATIGTHSLQNIGRIFGEAGFAKIVVEVAGEIRQWFSRE